MPGHDLDTVLGWRGRTVRDRAGERIGTLGELLLDRATDLPAWGGIGTGLFGRRQSYVPLARMEEDGDDLRVPYDKDQVTGAPAIDPDVALGEDDERALFEHYGERWEPPAGETAGEDVADGGGDDARRAGDDDAMTRSEEEVRLGPAERRPIERVRLRKVTVTEHVKRTVPVRREVVRLETDPPPEGRIESVRDVDG